MVAAWASRGLPRRRWEGAVGVVVEEEVGQGSGGAGIWGRDMGRGVGRVRGSKRAA